MALKLIDQNKLDFDHDSDIAEIRELWRKYASPKYIDLIDSDSLATTEKTLPVAMPEVVPQEPPKLEKPEKKLGKVLEEKGQS